MARIPQHAFLSRRMALVLAAVAFVGGGVYAAQAKGAASDAPSALTRASTGSCHPQSARFRRHRGRPSARSLAPARGRDC